MYANSRTRLTSLPFQLGLVFYCVCLAATHTTSNATIIISPIKSVEGPGDARVIRQDETRTKHGITLFVNDPHVDAADASRKISILIISHIIRSRLGENPSNQESDPCSIHL
ncbi:hypothetical protein FRC19_010727 [Serendipita sp. 401]|nr:hypothetical protein FRC19_010727 [Serendipita sp. 401]